MLCKISLKSIFEGFFNGYVGIIKVKKYWTAIQIEKKCKTVQGHI